MKMPDTVVDFFDAALRIAHFIWPIANACGWWLATTPNPAETQLQTAERLALRATGLLVLPVFVVWIWRDSLPYVGTWTPTVTEVVTLACFALAVYHVYLVVRFMGRLHRRCAPPDAKLIERKVLYRLRFAVRFVPSCVLALYLFNLAVDWRNFGQPGSTWGEGMGFVITGLLWLVVTANLLTTLRCIRAERIAAAYQDVSADL